MAMGRAWRSMRAWVRKCVHAARRYSCRETTEQVLRIYVEHDNAYRAHRTLGLQPSDPAVGLTLTGMDQPPRVHRRDFLGGLVHEYRQAA
jgi:hypothetical protein